MLYELRRYDVAPTGLPALLDRVHDRLREPTSYSQLDRGEAYGPDASTRRPYLFERREDRAMPPKIASITDRCGNLTCAAFEKQGFRQVGYGRNARGANDHQLVYLRPTASSPMQ